MQFSNLSYVPWTALAALATRRADLEGGAPLKASGFNLWPSYSTKTTKAPASIAAGLNLPQGREGFTLIVTDARYHLAFCTDHSAQTLIFDFGSGATFDGFAAGTLTAGGVPSLMQSMPLTLPHQGRD